jgi:hypothetical protein
VLFRSNGWDPAAHQLKPRTNGKRSVSVLMDAGAVVSFRYLAEGGHFFDDADADRFDDNGYGSTHSVIVLPSPKKAAPAAAPASTATKAKKTAPAKAKATPAARASAKPPTKKASGAKGKPKR